MANPTLSFGEALKLLKEGKRVSRSGWNGKGMWLFLVEGNWSYHPVVGVAFPVQPFIAMKTADDKIVPWLASQTDILAEDWGVIFQYTPPNL